MLLNSWHRFCLRLLRSTTGIHSSKTRMLREESDLLESFHGSLLRRRLYQPSRLSDVSNKIVPSKFAAVRERRENGQNAPRSRRSNQESICMQLQSRQGEPLIIRRPVPARLRSLRSQTNFVSLSKSADTPPPRTPPQRDIPSRRFASEFYPFSFLPPKHLASR